MNKDFNQSYMPFYLMWAISSLLVVVILTAGCQNSVNRAPIGDRSRAGANNNSTGQKTQGEEDLFAQTLQSSQNCDGQYPNLQDLRRKLNDLQSPLSQRSARLHTVQAYLLSSNSTLETQEALETEFSHLEAEYFFNHVAHKLHSDVGPLALVFDQALPYTIERQENCSHLIMKDRQSSEALIFNIVAYSRDSLTAENSENPRHILRFSAQDGEHINFEEFYSQDSIALCGQVAPYWVHLQHQVSWNDRHGSEIKVSSQWAKLLIQANVASQNLEPLLQRSTNGLRRPDIQANQPITIPANEWEYALFKALNTQVAVENCVTE